MQRLIRDGIFALLAVTFAQGVRAEVSDDKWWERQFNRGSTQSQRPPVRASSSVPYYVPKPAAPVLGPETKDPVGVVVLDPMPINVSLPGKVIVFFITLQQFAAYDNGKMIEHNGALLRGPISSGSPGHATPITNPKNGPHTVGLRQVDYVSNTYPEPDGGAPMPYAQFFRNDGIALHAGYIDTRSRAQRLNHGLSHGCVRLMHSHAKILYELNVDRAMKVIVVRTVDDLLMKWEFGYFAQPI